MKNLQFAITQCALVALCALASLLVSSSASARGVYQEPGAFLGQAFGQSPPEPKMLWLSQEQQVAAARILGHGYAALRVRYWLRDGRSAWVLDEIGKEQPITIGVVIEQGKVESVRVLEFRESRGDEVRHAFFTKRFQGAGLDRQWLLNRQIDNITGASMSVRAVTKVVNLALYFHEQVRG